MTITPEGGRVLGCLVEKQLTTPQQYPLTLNALMAACNQSTNRHPVMALDDLAVEHALEELKVLRTVRFVLPSHGKSVTRFRHVLDEVYGLDAARLALLAVLLLRGPQTPGALRGRAGRMAELSSVSAVLGELEVLAGQPEPLVRLLPRRPGQKEDRFQQLLAAESSGAGAAESSGAGAAGSAPVIVEESDRPGSYPSPVQTGGRGVSTESPGATDDHADLEARVDVLASEVADLRQQVVELRASLDALRQGLGG